MPGRQFNNGNYRYGFNGKENDNEVKGTGNSVDFGSRIYDPRLGRWLSVDPLQQKYPNVSPYNFGLDNPIYFIDKDGNVIYDKNGNRVELKRSEDGKTVEVANAGNIDPELVNTIQNTYAIVNSRVFDPPFQEL